MLLNTENYTKGFLVDEECMAGVGEHPDKPGQFVAFVVSLQTGDYLGYELFESLEQALKTIHDMDRKWTFQALSHCEGGCGDHGGHGHGGGCGGGGGEGGCCGGGGHGHGHGDDDDGGGCCGSHQH